MSYYPSAHSYSSHRSHVQPVAYSNSNQGYYRGYAGSRGSGAGYYPTAQSQYSPRPNNYYPQPSQVQYVPSRRNRSSSRHRSSRRHEPRVAYADSSRYNGSGSRTHRRNETLGDRIMRFFGLRSRQSSSRRYNNWPGWSGLFGPHRDRTRYMDPRTGEEVDRMGRRIYRY